MANARTSDSSDAVAVNSREASERGTAEATARRLRNLSSRAALVLAVATLAASWFLISPPSDWDYPGAIPWSEFSMLKSLTEWLALGGLLETARGVEIKDFVFHLGAGAALLLLAVRAAISARWVVPQRTAKRAWFYAQVLLAAWVGVSLFSASWSGDVPISLGQGVLYGLAVAWAVALAWTLESRDVPRLLAGLVAICAAGALLCIWHFYERNPYHKPGFPLGNPNVLAACCVSALLIAGSVLAGAARCWFVRGPPAQRWVLVGAALALVPLSWCLVLTGSLAALIGLAAGVAAVVFFRGGRRVRAAVSVAAAALVLVLGWWVTSAHFEQFSGSRPTVRFRVYAWRHATEMWQRREILGAGAGCYTRFARQYAVADRTLDPAAFMGDWTAHAHNELFEVLAEIGLIGGVTFVGGFVATLAAILALLRSNLSDERRWLFIGLAAGLVAQIVGLMFSAGLHLPGEPAVFYTLLGTIWAACRCAARTSATAGTEHQTGGLSGPAARRVVVIGAALIGAVGAGWLAVRNWQGVLYERAAEIRAEARQHESLAAAEARCTAAVAHFESAGGLLLDPVRMLFADARAVQSRLDLAAVAVARAAASAADDRTDAEGRWQVAIKRLRETYFAAERVNGRAPSILRMPALAARSAEHLAKLYRRDDPAEARQWRTRATQAWALQKRYDPYDVEALLALVHTVQEWPDRGRGLMPRQITWLRDALRGGNARRFGWLPALENIASLPGFAETLAQFERAAGPIHPETDLEALIASMAAELYRLIGHWHALRGGFQTAADYAARAAQLYEPMRPRFPRLASVALAEQGAYLLAAGREDEASRVFAEALQDDEALPVLVEVSYRQLVEQFYQRPAESRPPVRDWIAAVLRRKPDDEWAWSRVAWLEAETGNVDAVRSVLERAAAAGVPPDAMQRIRDYLCREFPALKDGIRSP